MTGPFNLFWDTCVFIPYIVGDENAECFADICRFVEEAKGNKRKIHFSTMVYAEIQQECIKAGFNVSEFFSDLGSNFYPIDGLPNILIAAGELRKSKSTNPGDPNPPKQRAIGTPDAIHLMSALFARDVLGISDIVFHTFDGGGSKGTEGRTIPILGFEKWFPVETRTDRVKEVCGLPRSKPIHPEPMFESVVIHGKFKSKDGAGSGPVA